MNVLSIIAGLLVGLLTPILIVVATAAATIVGFGRDAVTGKKASRKATKTAVRGAGTDAAVVKMLEKERDEEVRAAA